MGIAENRRDELSNGARIRRAVDRIVAMTDEERLEILVKAGRFTPEEGERARRNIEAKKQAR